MAQGGRRSIVEPPHCLLIHIAGALRMAIVGSTSVRKSRRQGRKTHVFPL